MLENRKYFWLMAVALLSAAVALASPQAVEAYLDEGTGLKRGKLLLGEFRAPLSAEDEARCLDFLRHKFLANEVAIGRVRQNDLADWLLQRPAHTEFAALALFEIIEDEEADLLWREFCVQKLAIAATQPVLSESTRNRCAQVLVEKAGDPRMAFSGTALLGLYHLSASEKVAEVIDAEHLIELAEHILEGAQFATANKVTALQVAGLSGSRKAVELARSIAFDDSRPMQMRVSAVALLGSRGEASDLPELKRLRQSLDSRLRKSANAAIQNLTS
ncbi:MAG: hypothetical protein EA353_11250 [Puniceicoccaceae bacterium]|nr:MAG: hypothetical protein EA353_11250 [Puniceicoccaceae bacterium]